MARREVVVGGYREGKTPGTVGSLLLGLYDDRGRLHHVGVCASFTAAFRRETVLVRDIETDPLWVDYRELALAHGLRACCGYSS